MEYVFNYYALDWLAMGLGFLATYLVGNQNRYGFLMFMFSAICWMAVGILTNSSAMIIGNVVFFALNARGFMRWLRKTTSVALSDE